LERNREKEKRRKREKSEKSEKSEKTTLKPKVLYKIFFIKKYILYRTLGLRVGFPLFSLFSLPLFFTYVFFL